MLQILIAVISHYLPSVFCAIWPIGTAAANWLSPFVTIRVTSRPVDRANTGMDMPTDSPRIDLTTNPLLTEKDACAYLRVSKCNPTAGAWPDWSPISKLAFQLDLGNLIWTPPSSGCGFRLRL